MSKLALNSGQAAAVSAMLNFLSDPSPESHFFVLSGSAGTGKTFSLREVLSAFEASHGKIAFTAPTNKAAKELRKITGKASTIYALLGLRITAKGEVKELEVGKNPNIDLSEYDAIVVDEGGMISSQLYHLIQDVAIKYNVKFIFSGDKFQLPPVKERQSPIWNIDNGADLLEVMRHDNQILKLVTRIRDAMTKPLLNIKIDSDNADGEGVFKLTKYDFKKRIFSDAMEGKFADSNQTKVIAWRNATVGTYNQLIRTAIYGAGAAPYEAGERIIAAAPCFQGDDTILTTDEEAMVESAVTCNHPIEPRFQAIELKARTEDNRVIRLLVLHPESFQDFDNACQQLAHQAKQNPKMWKSYWNLKELFHEIKYAYAITAHRAQGSTYDNVYVDYQDILMNRERMEAFQCLYVACSRPRKTLILA